MPVKDIEVNARWQAAMAECFPTCKRRSPTPVETGVALWCGGSRRPTMTRDDRGRGRRYDATDEPTAHAVSSSGPGSGGPYPEPRVTAQALDRGRVCGCVARRGGRRVRATHLRGARRRA